MHFDRRNTIQKLFAPLYYLRITLIDINSDHRISRILYKKLDSIINDLFLIWNIFQYDSNDIELMKKWNSEKLTEYNRIYDHFFQKLPYKLGILELKIEELRPFIDEDDYIRLYCFNYFIDIF